MKQDTKEVLNAIVDSVSLQIKAMIKMNDHILSLEHRIAELTEALDEQSDEIEKLKSEVASLPRGGAIKGDRWDWPYTPQYPQAPNWPTRPWQSPVVYCVSSGLQA